MFLIGLRKYNLTVDVTFLKIGFTNFDAVRLDLFSTVNGLLKVLGQLNSPF